MTEAMCLPRSTNCKSLWQTQPPQLPLRPPPRPWCWVSMRGRGGRGGGVQAAVTVMWSEVTQGCLRAQLIFVTDNALFSSWHIIFHWKYKGVALSKVYPEKKDSICQRKSCWFKIPKNPSHVTNSPSRTSANTPIVNLRRCLVASQLLS